MARKPSKGYHRPIYEALIFHERFQPLSSDARALWLALKLTLGPAGIARKYDEELADASGLAVGDQLDAARADLIEYEWLEVEGRIHWLVEGFANEPYHATKNSRKSIAQTLDGLSGEIVDRFRERYGFPREASGKASGKASGNPNGKPRHPARARGGRGSTAEVVGGGKLKDPSGEPSGEPRQQTSSSSFVPELRHYLAGRGRLVADASKRWGSAWVAHVWTHYGPGGTSAKALQGVPDPDRPAVLAGVLTDLLADSPEQYPRRAVDGFVRSAAKRYARFAGPTPYQRQEPPAPDPELSEEERAKNRETFEKLREVLKAPATPPTKGRKT